MAKNQTVNWFQPTQRTKNTSPIVLAAHLRQIPDVSATKSLLAEWDFYLRDDLSLWLAMGLRKQRVDDIADHALFGARQLVDLFELLLNFPLRSTLAGSGAFGQGADEFFDSDAELVCQVGQSTGEQVQASGFVMGERLLRDAHRFG